MATPNPEHLIQQAERLVVPPPAGPPRQVDVRRAISSAYYAVFHAILTAAADQVVGITQHADPHFGLVYRSISHNALRSLCQTIRQAQVQEIHRPHLPNGVFDANLTGLAAAVLELQDKRTVADYDPMLRLKTSDALTAISTARAALGRLAAASPDARKAFIMLLLFPPRR